MSNRHSCRDGVKMLKRITLDFKIANCQYRCLHCDGAKNDECGNIPIQKIKEIVHSFLQHKGSLFENLFVFISDSAFLYNDFPALVGFLNKHGIRYKKEPINGAIYDKSFFKLKFPEIAKSSLDSVRITLFGLEATHNKFAGHRDSFNELIKIARAFTNCNKHIIFHLYITPESITEIDILKNYLVSEFSKSTITYEYSNCYKGNYYRRHHFLLTEPHREMARKWDLSLVSENEFVESFKGKRPIIWHKNLWIRAFSNGDCQVAIFPLGSFYQAMNLNSSSPETIIQKCIALVQDMENKLPSFDRLIDEVYDPEDPFLYSPSDALSLWWARYIREKG